MNCGHVSAHQSKRVLVGANGDTQGLPGCADEGMQRSNVCPQLPVVGTSSASSVNEKPQADLPFFGRSACPPCDGHAPQAPLLLHVRSKNPVGVSDTSSGLRIAVFGGPGIMQMGEGGEWGYRIRTDFCTEQNVEP